jgi:mannitol/fructose-specific phosphotransferase system IIA component
LADGELLPLEYSIGNYIFIGHDLKTRRQLVQGVGIEVSNEKVYLNWDEEAFSKLQ